MFGLCCKRFQLLIPSRSFAVNSVTQFPFTASYSSRSLLGSEIHTPKRNQQDKDSSFTVSYLIDSCGISPEIALTMSKEVHFENRDRPDSVIKLLKDYGLDDSFIPYLVQKLPRLLIYNADKILLPKLEFFGSIGLSGNVLAKALCRNPVILTRSLEKCIIPCYDFIKSIVVHDKNVAIFFRTSKWAVSGESLRNVASNVAILKALQVPDTTVSVYLTWFPLILCRGSEKLKKDVKKVTSMGIEPSSSSKFMKALVVIGLLDASQQEQKMKFYKEWGWTDNDFLLAFRKNPMIMTFTEENLLSKMNFLQNKLGWEPAVVAQNSYVLTYSLEKRIIPRFSVIEILRLKGLTTKVDCSILKKSEKYFLDKYVLKYQKQVPELSSIFEGKIGLAELGLGFGDRARVNQI